MANDKDDEEAIRVNNDLGDMRTITSKYKEYIDRAEDWRKNFLFRHFEQVYKSFIHPELRLIAEGYEFGEYRLVPHVKEQQDANQLTSSFDLHVFLYIDLESNFSVPDDIIANLNAESKPSLERIASTSCLGGVVFDTHYCD